MLFLLLLTISVSTCLQHSLNLGTALLRFPVQEARSGPRRGRQGDAGRGLRGGQGHFRRGKEGFVNRSLFFTETDLKIY